MTKEKYVKPIMEVIDLKDDVILTSGGAIPICIGADAGGCPPVAVCIEGCPLDSCSYDNYNDSSFGLNMSISC